MVLLGQAARCRSLKIPAGAARKLLQGLSLDSDDLGRDKFPVFVVGLLMLSPPDAEFHFDKIPVSLGVFQIGKMHVLLAVAVGVNYFCHGLKIHKGLN